MTGLVVIRHDILVTEGRVSSRLTQQTDTVCDAGHDLTLVLLNTLSFVTSFHSFEAGIANANSNDEKYHYTILSFITIFRHLKLELLTQIPASNDEKYHYTILSFITIFRHLKLELLTQIPASNDEKYYYL